MRSKIDFPTMCMIAGLPRPRGGSRGEELQFHPTRKWRFDWCWEPQRIAVEFEGGVFVGGSHTRGSRYSSDAMKYNEAQFLGWKVYRYTAKFKESDVLSMLRKIREVHFGNQAQDAQEQRAEVSADF